VEGDNGVFLDQLQKLVLQATNLKRPNEEFIDIFKKVEEY